MKTMTFRAIAAALLVLSTSGLASADYTFTLSNVQLTLGAGGTNDGTLTGTFTTNNALTMLVSYDIKASAAGNFAGFEYTPTSAPVSVNSLPSFFQLDSSGSADELRLIFAGGLTATGATLSTSSYEFETAGGTRDVASGSVIVAAVVPEPASIALTGSALAIAVVGARVRRRRKA
jgi:hypothetical protein